jgi:hypothetical protein
MFYESTSALFAHEIENTKPRGPPNLGGKIPRNYAGKKLLVSKIRAQQSH